MGVNLKSTNPTEKPLENFSDKCIQQRNLSSLWSLLEVYVLIVVLFCAVIRPSVFEERVLSLMLNGFTKADSQGR